MSAQRTEPSGPRPYDRSSAEAASFSRNLRYELASDEGRALLGSYVISGLLGIAFLLFVYLYPARPPENRPTEIVYLPLPPEQPVQPPVAQAEQQPEPQSPAPGPRSSSSAPRGPRPQPRGGQTSTSTGAVDANAFGNVGSTGGVAGSIAGALAGVEVAGGGGQPAGGGTGTRAVISGGGGSGSAGTPGRGGVAGGAGTGGIGQVGGGGGGVGRAGVSISPPSVVDAPDMGPSRDMGALGTYVRSRQRELQFCYEEHGLKVNPSLAGTITVAIGIAGNGRVNSASVSRRSWGGAGASAVESCVLGKIRAWRFPSSGTGDGVYSFPFNFTR